MKKRKVKIGEQRYLVQLEPYFWQSVDKILDEEKITFSFLCTELNRLKTVCHIFANQEPDLINSEEIRIGA